MKLITEELLDTVTSRAKENSRLRMNYNFHASMDAPIHRLLNALEPGTYLPPHRHTDKEETYLVLRGSLLAFFYDDAGNVTDKVCLNPSEGKYGLEIPSNTWHSIIALESGTVIFEIKKGPYQPLPSEDLASWAPQASDVEGIKAFMKRMLELLCTMLLVKARLLNFLNIFSLIEVFGRSYPILPSPPMLSSHPCSAFRVHIR